LAVHGTAIDGLVRISAKTVTDHRGSVREFYRESSFLDAGLPSLGPWVQLNVTETRRGAIRGLHGEAMHKLVGVAAGAAYGAYLDARPDSPTHGVVETIELVPGAQILVPPGVCNGFQAVGEGMTPYVYCFDSEWMPGMAGVAYAPLDPALAIDWPIGVDPDDPAQLSVKDRDAHAFGDPPRDDRP
ncbi:MAG: dTDP-4-dehydrorhamnose 3,5-epimerase family protein, partial [Thermoleophilaceae bacterium]